MKNIHILPTDKPSRLWMTKLGNLTRCHDIKPIKEALGNNVNNYITSDEEIKEGNWFVKPKYSKAIKIGYEISQADSSFFGGYGYDWTDCKKIILTTDQDLIKDGVQAIDDEFLEWFVKNPSCEFVELNRNYNRGNGKYYYKIIIPKEEAKQLFTDYPIIELGDDEFKEAPIRECELLSFDDDDNKYCYVKVGGIEKEIKRCYIYPQKGRCGDVNCVSIKEIKELLKEEPKQDAIEYSLNAFKVPKEYFGKQETLGEALSEHIKDIKYPTLIQCAKFGAKWQQQRSYSEEEVLDLLQDFANDLSDNVINIKFWFEKFKNK